MSFENLYIGSSGVVCAINPQNGSEIWRTHLTTTTGVKTDIISSLIYLFSKKPSASLSTKINTRYQDINVAEDNGIVLAGCNGYVFGLDAKSGKQLWSSELKDIDGNDVTLSIGGKTIQSDSQDGINSDNLYIGCNGFVCAINPKDGSEIWSTKLMVEMDTFFAPLISLFSKNAPASSLRKMTSLSYKDVSIVEDNDIVLVGCEGFVLGLDAKSGKQLWSHDLKGTDRIFRKDVTLSIRGKTVQTVSKPEKRDYNVNSYTHD